MTTRQESPAVPPPRAANASLPPASPAHATGHDHPPANVAAPAATGTAPQPTTVGVIAGDRLCTHCGFNLHGALILREPHYRLLIARCPECGTVAALQEYPGLGRWAGRWSAMAAALWVLTLLSGLVGGALAHFLWIREGVIAGATPLALVIARFHRRWGIEQAEASGDAARVKQWRQAGPPSSYEWIDPGVFKVHSLEFMIADGGGRAALRDWDGTLRTMLSSIPSLVAIGVVASVALVGVPRRRLWMVAPLFLLGTLLFWVDAIGRFYGNAWGWGGRPASWVAAEEHDWPVILVCALFAFAATALGMHVGRPIVRGLVRLLLPPRLRLPLSILWTCDGLTPPTRDAAPPAVKGAAPAPGG